jgi:hypothetical protein
MTMQFDAYVTAALFDAKGAACFALGDGTVRFETGLSVQAHEGVPLDACLHPSGAGVITGGDDGRLVWTTVEGAVELAKVPGRWIDAVAASKEPSIPRAAGSPRRPMAGPRSGTPASPTRSR